MNLCRRSPAKTSLFYKANSEDSYPSNVSTDLPFQVQKPSHKKIEWVKIFITYDATPNKYWILVPQKLPPSWKFIKGGESKYNETYMGPIGTLNKAVTCFKNYCIDLKNRGLISKYTILSE